MIAKFKDALLSKRTEYFKWLHKIRVAKFCGKNKKDNLITLHNITPTISPEKNTLLYRFEDDLIDIVRKHELNPVHAGDGTLLLVPSNVFGDKKYIPLGIEVSYDIET